MATTSGIAAADSDYLKVTTETKKQSQLDKDAFMKLLVTQMKYQDPLNPMDNQEMMAQLAQFTALEQMTNVAKSAEKQFANSMLGKQVSYTYKDTTTGTSQDFIGKVDYVKLNGGEVLLGIGNKEIELKNVQQVIDSNSIESNTTAFELMGKTVQGVIQQTNKDGTKEDVIIEGEVKGIQMKNNAPFLIIGTGASKVEVDFAKVQNIVDKPTITGKKVTAKVTAEDGTVSTITGTAEYIKILKAGTYIYVNGQFVDFSDIETITNE